MIWHLDEPSDPIAVCMFHAAELAARHVKVVLGRDGGDELFAGFDRYLGLLHLDRYSAVPTLIRQRLISPLLARLPDSFTYKSLTQKLRWINQLSGLAGDGERYAEATCFFRFNHQEKRSLLNDDLWREVGHLNSAEVIVKPFRQENAANLVDRMLYTDLMTRLPEHSLMLTDRMTMAHSLEARSPFLDHTLVEYLAAFPSNLKIRGRQLKYILRRAAADYLPKPIVRREKQGFMFPIAYWFQHELRGFIGRFLLDSYFVRAGLFKRETVLSLLAEHQSNRVDHHVRLWMLLNLELWYQITIEQRSVESVRETLERYLANGRSGNH
jgi:asparagine synthase (glutamine-hydrolysing)